MVDARCEQEFRALDKEQRGQKLRFSDSVKPVDQSLGVWVGVACKNY